MKRVRTYGHQSRAHLPRACRWTAARRFSSPARTPRARPCCCGRPSSFRRVRRAAEKTHRFAPLPCRDAGPAADDGRPRFPYRTIPRPGHFPPFKRRLALSATDGVYTRDPGRDLDSRRVIGATTADMITPRPRCPETARQSNRSFSKCPPVKRPKYICMGHAGRIIVFLRAQTGSQRENRVRHRYVVIERY